MRKPRLLIEGKCYSVLAKVNRQECIFKADIFRYIMLQTLERAKTKYNFELRNFCIKECEVHFLIKPIGSDSLSKIMHWILFVSAMSYNRLLKIHGHVWQDRFKSRIIETMNDYLKKFLFIVSNSLKNDTIDNWDNQFSGIFYIMNGIFDFVTKPPDEFLENIWGMVSCNFNNF